MLRRACALTHAPPVITLKSLAAGAFQAPAARQQTVRKAQPCARREATSYRAMPVATAALRDSTVDAIGIDTI